MQNNKAFSLLELMLAIVIIFIIIQFLVGMVLILKTIQNEDYLVLNSVKTHLRYELALSSDFECYDNKFKYVNHKQVNKSLYISKNRLVKGDNGFEILLSNVNEFYCLNNKLEFYYKHRYIKIEY